MSNNSLLTPSKVTMVVNSCDEYKDVWPLFFCALDEYWPNRAFGVVINSGSEVKKIKKTKLYLNNVDKDFLINLKGKNKTKLDFK